jgi:hypothetical protein
MSIADQIKKTTADEQKLRIQAELEDKKVKVVEKNLEDLEQEKQRALQAFDKRISYIPSQLAAANGKLSRTRGEMERIQHRLASLNKENKEPA